MKENITSTPVVKHGEGRILVISVLIGLVAGSVNAGYRLALSYAETASFAMYDWVAEHKIWLPLALLILGVAGYGIGLLCSKFKLIGGSGIPQLKAQMLGYIKNTWFATLVAKFIGGCVSALGGLSLGREGPSIQLGACVAEGIAGKVTKSQSERRIYMASGASAGLAAAFHAPLAGSMFVIEEIFGYISPMVLLSSMVSAVVADMVGMMVFGGAPVFHFDIVTNIPLEHYWILGILGIVLGVAGSVYNLAMLKAQWLYRKIKNTKVRIVIPFVTAGLLAMVFPVALGGGHAAMEQLHNSTTITMLLLIFVVKFLFSMVSFGSGAPGGIFFPLLVLGASTGALFAKCAITLFGFDPILFDNIVILAMVGYFTAIVRAPITGVILILEMTGSFSQLVPLIITSIVAYVVANACKSKPIYESLMESLLHSHQMEGQVHDAQQIIVTAIIQHGAGAEGQMLRDLPLPPKCLLIKVQRGGETLIPNGDTQFRAGDQLTMLTDLTHEVGVRESMLDLTVAE